MLQLLLKEKLVYLSNLLVFTTLAATSTSSATNNTSRKEVLARTYPYLVSINDFKSEKFLCAGTIITRTYILSAAACVKGYQAGYDNRYVNRHNDRYEHESRYETASSLTVLLGDGKKCTIESLRTEIGEMFEDNNIAVLQTTNQILLNSKVQLVRLTKSNFGIKDKANGVTVAWSVFPDKGPDGKVFVNDIVIYNNSTCGSKFKYNNMSRTMCVAPSSSKYNQRSCTIYIGGPVVSNGVQVGIVFKESTCLFSQEEPKLATMVSKHLDWLKNNSNYKGEYVMVKGKVIKGSNASSFRALFLFKSLAFCVTVSWFNC